MTEVATNGTRTDVRRAIDEGGHFAGWQQPELFSSRAAFASLR